MKDVTIQAILALDVKPQDKVDELVKLAYAALAEAETLTEAHGCRLGFSITYGAGATYSVDWDASSDEEGHTPYAWNASSQSC